ncbi:MAG: hypothetical protein B7X02_02575 [Rhodospirillales bacterium 12-54-5]|nr:MAG: hypothetical protein B7X02_02575 [Rhodospirillales bacterium 12-54-5]
MSVSQLTIATDTQKLVTMRLDNQRFGIPVCAVRDVLKDQLIAPIPKAPSDIAGAINLRGRIVTVIDMRNRLGLTTHYGASPTFIVVDFNGEYFCLLVDRVNEVLAVESSYIEPCPANMDDAWREVASGIYPLQSELLVIIDVHKLLSANL